MNRRESLKFIGVGSISAGMVLGACKLDPQTNAPADELPEVLETGREDFEIERDRRLLSEKFFDDHEMATIAVLADIIIPKDERSGSATDAGVPDFIEFIVKDMPEHQLPMRGGLKWLDTESLRRFGKAFIDATSEQRIEIVEDIAYPFRVKPGMEQGVAFFNRIRDLTATGFFTSEIGIQDLDYQGNRPGPWNGTPREILEQYGLTDEG